jgi:hypothetical protein
MPNASETNHSGGLFVFLILFFVIRAGVLAVFGQHLKCSSTLQVQKKDREL